MAEAVDSNELPSNAAAASGYVDDRDDNDNEDDNTPYYRDRPEWKDVVPLKQTGAPGPVIQIDYTPRFLDCFDYFRAVMATGEKTHRVLDLTTDAIGLNAANYTVWQYRRDVLQALGVPQLITKDGLASEFQKEFDFSLQSIEENEKNYQVWHHRKILAQWAAGYNDETGTVQLTCPNAQRLLSDQELDLTCKMLEKDAKNYHTWQYRQWILDCLKCFDEELFYVEELLTKDVRNNSAWNQRYFVITSVGDVTSELVHQEIKYTWDKILQAPSNESPWNYLAGLFRLIPDVTVINTPQIVTLCEDFLSESVKRPSPPLLSFLLSVYQKLLETGSGDSPEAVYQRCLEICDLLLETDKIRTAYWNYMKGKFQTKFGSNTPASASVS